MCVGLGSGEFLITWVDHSAEFLSAISKSGLGHGLFKSVRFLWYIFIYVCTSFFSTPPCLFVCNTFFYLLSLFTFNSFSYRFKKLFFVVFVYYFSNCWHPFVYIVYLCWLTIGFFCFGSIFSIVYIRLFIFLCCHLFVSLFVYKNFLNFLFFLIMSHFQAWHFQLGLFFQISFWQSARLKPLERRKILELRCAASKIFQDRANNPKQQQRRAKRCSFVSHC